MNMYKIFPLIIIENITKDLHLKMATRYPVHECVFKNDVRLLSKLLRTDDVDQKDKHGIFKFHS